MTRHANKCLMAVAAFIALRAGGTPAQTTSSAPATSPTAVAAPTAAGTTYDLSVAAGGQFRDVSGSTEKFEEYGQAGEGFVLDNVLLRTQRPASGYHMELRIQDARQNDERYRLTVGRQGRYRVTLGYDAIPHRFATGTFLFNGIGTERLQIADVAQEQLQANETPGAARGVGPPPSATDPTVLTTGDVEQQRIVNGLYSAANRASLGLVRKQFSSQLEIALPADARAWVRVMNENRTGTRVIDAGAYERWQDANGIAHTIDRFIVLGAELAEPLDYRTLGVAAGAGVQRESWLADVEYSFTHFRNFDDVLLWDNPFRITDAAQVGSIDRSRFAVGQLVLPTNSLSHEVTASGGVNLPLHGRLGASLSYGIITQDDPFFPYTRNSAIIATDFTGAPVGPASTAALPARDLDGDVRTIAGNVSATVRPIQPVTVSAKYRLYRYDNKSDQITFPGYAAFGESGWRREKNDVTGGLDAPVANELFDYWRHEADLGIDYRVTRMLSLSVEGGWEAWRFDHSRLDKLDEYAVGGGFAVRPVRNASFKARYRFSDRTNDGYLQGSTAENPEARGLLNYNWADRRRHLADARIQYSPTRVVSLGALGRFITDKYSGDTEGGTAIDSFRFGRTAFRSWLGSADVTVTPIEMVSVHANYSFEYRREKMASGAKDDGAKATDDFGFADSFAPENYWNARIKETVNSVGAGTTVQLVPGKLALDAGYSLSFSDTDVNTFNPNAIAATTLANAVAVDWPTIKNRLHEVVGDLGYRIRPDIRAGLRYVFRSYDLDDFAWDRMQPYMAGLSAENSTRYVFADATYHAYQSHVGTVYVSGTF